MATCILWGTCPMRKVTCKYRVKRGAASDPATRAQLVADAFHQGLMSGPKMGACVMGGTPSKGTARDGRLASNQGSKKSSGGKSVGGKTTSKGTSGKSGGKSTPPRMGKGGY
jgi:hypothetical protein